jgi:hypothetical protein
MLRNDPEAAHYEIDPTRLDLVEEFRRKPRGPHSRDLQLVLHRMRWGPVAGRYVLVTLEPGKRWVLGQLPGERGAKIEIHHNRSYSSLEAAEWDVFKLRWAALTGREIEEKP